MAVRKTMTKTQKKPEAEVVEKTAVEPKKEKRTYKDTDKIPCISITSGEYLFIGDKSGNLYDWISEGDVVEMRYDDLIAAIRTRKPCVFMPRVVIQDEEFLEEFQELKRMYNSLYSAEDMNKILSLPAEQMRKVIEGLPDGAKDSIKSLAITAVDEGRLDSVQRIRILDQIFVTDMLLKLTQ